MSRKIAVVCCLVLLVCMQATAQDMGDKGLRVSTGFFSMKDSALSDAAGTSFMVSVDKLIKEDDSKSVYASIGYTTASGDTSVAGLFTDEAKVTTIPMMVTVRKDLNQQAVAARLYVGAGLGLAYSNSKVTTTSSDYFPPFPTAVGQEGDIVTTSTVKRLNPAFQLLAGVEFGRNMFTEAKYINGGQDANTGWSLSLGAKF